MFDLFFEMLKSQICEISKFWNFEMLECSHFEYVFYTMIYIYQVSSHLKLIWQWKKIDESRFTHLKLWNSEISNFTICIYLFLLSLFLLFMLLSILQWWHLFQKLKMEVDEQYLSNLQTEAAWFSNFRFWHFDFHVWDWIMLMFEIHNGTNSFLNMFMR